MFESLRANIAARRAAQPDLALPPGGSGSLRAARASLRAMSLREHVDPHFPIAWPTWPPGTVPKITAAVQKVVRRLLRWYINPIVEQQNQYNAAATATVTRLTDALERLSLEHAETLARLTEAEARLAELERRDAP